MRLCRDKIVGVAFGSDWCVVCGLGLEWNMCTLILQKYVVYIKLLNAHVLIPTLQLITVNLPPCLTYHPPSWLKSNFFANIQQLKLTHFTFSTARTFLATALAHHKVACTEDKPMAKYALLVLVLLILFFPTSPPLISPSSTCHTPDKHPHPQESPRRELHCPGQG